MSSSPTNDIASGQHALTYFHNEALKYPQNYSWTLQQLFDNINTNSPSLIQSLGANIADSQATDSQVSAFMTALADQGQGEMPTLYSSFINFTVDLAETNLSFTANVESGVAAGVTQVAGVAASVGNAAVVGVKGTLYAAPLIIGAAVLLFVYMQSKEI